MQQTAEIIKISEKVKPAPLSSLVKEVLEQYFIQLNGHETTGLHAMLISEVEKPLIETTLNHCGQNQTKASKILGLSRSTLRKKIKLYGLS
ncbi:MAG: helix-turn-helix domain-containing protein [Methylococcales bacterium]|jgi:Fis family transcriptional regulator